MGWDRRFAEDGNRMVKEPTSSLHRPASLSVKMGVGGNVLPGVLPVLQPGPEWPPKVPKVRQTTLCAPSHRPCSLKVLAGRYILFATKPFEWRTTLFLWVLQRVRRGPCPWHSSRRDGAAPRGRRGREQRTVCTTRPPAPSFPFSGVATGSARVVGLPSTGQEPAGATEWPQSGGRKDIWDSFLLCL